MCGRLCGIVLPTCYPPTAEKLPTMAAITTVTARAKLGTQHDPHWHRVSTGCYVGFRKMTTTTAGVWVLRVTDPVTGKYVKKSLGALDEYPDHQRFDVAVKAAIEWRDHSDRGGLVQAKTVADACTHYVAHFVETKGEQKAKEVQQRLQRFVLSDPKLAALELTKLTPAIIGAWRTKLAKTGQMGYGERNGTKRADSTINRDMTTFRAVLNMAYKDGWLTTDFAWRGKLVSIKGAGTARMLYLSREQRDAFCAHAEPDAANFLRGLCALPLRPGALADLKVGHFNAKLSVLTVGKDKAGGDRNIKLPPNTAALFESVCKGRPQSAYAFVRDDGEQWCKDKWKYPIKYAAAAAGLPRGTTAYTLRHSVITDLVVGGLDLLTVARLSGTSVAMIQAHYGHLRADHAANALAALTA